ncbi:hypothetical protein [Jiulongibacter sp. NS-SX5]|uniref:hypothetical protein n=1 Tax=Jiulongibacter sp. NS-SX5 TaxID=3463854 RepID=UPI004057E97D
MFKKILAFAIIAFSTVQLSAQSFDLSDLDSAVSLFKEGKEGKAAGILSNAVGGLTKVANQSNSEFAPKILTQASALSGMLPSIRSGNINLGSLQKIVNTVKTLIAANRLRGMLNQGSLLGKGSELSSNVGILQSGLGMLGGGQSSKLDKMLGMVSKKSSKLDGGGLFKNMASKAVSKKLNSSLGLINGMF